MEMREMKEKVDIEIEAFIHGAMLSPIQVDVHSSNHLDCKGFQQRR